MLKNIYQTILTNGILRHVFLGGVALSAASLFQLAGIKLQYNYFVYSMLACSFLIALEVYLKFNNKSLDTFEKYFTSIFIVCTLGIAGYTKFSPFCIAMCYIILLEIIQIFMLTNKRLYLDTMIKNWRDITIDIVAGTIGIALTTALWI